jgi:hypothetical protein
VDSSPLVHDVVGDFSAMGPANLGDPDSGSPW